MSGFANSGRVFLMALNLAVAGCGGGSGGGGDSGPPVGSVEAAFTKASADTGIPARYMMATGYLESHLASANATANYVSTTKGAQQTVARGTIITQTAFGVSFADLGLDPNKAESATLEVQIDAYAHWLQQKFKTGGVSLTSNPQTADDKFYWISNLALLHRRGMDQRRNVQILFARELIQILNAGFVWQDARSGDKLILPKESDPISVDKFPINGQTWFRLVTPTANAVLGVTVLPLVTVPAGGTVNKPRHVDIIHCPLTLSACLELQTRSADSDIRLAAHYVIPPIQPNDATPDSALNGVFQVADLSEALAITTPKGDNVLVQDAVVIMLVGNSGRMVAGSRQPALPNWFTDPQLRSMAQVVNNVCTLLAQQDPSVDRGKCMAPTGDNGVQFSVQSPGEEYRWGNIADYDPTIFQAYLSNPGGLSTDVQFDFTGIGQDFNAGDNIALSAVFDSSARDLELERLSRCPNGAVVWEPVRTDQVRNQTQATLNEAFHDSGPNRNGEQYFRLRLYGKDGHLMGWTMGNVLQHNYEPDAEFASDKYCSAGE